MRQERQHDIDSGVEVTAVTDRFQGVTDRELESNEMALVGNESLAVRLAQVENLEGVGAVTIAEGRERWFAAGCDRDGRKQADAFVRKQDVPGVMVVDCLGIRGEEGRSVPEVRTGSRLDDAQMRHRFSSRRRERST